MPILNLQKGEVGLVGVEPSIVYILTNDTLAEVTAAGYLNKVQANGAQLSESSVCLVTTKTTPSATTTQVGWLEVSYDVVLKNWSLVSGAAPGSVTLPTIANHISVFTNVTGAMANDVATAINGGNIAAGLSGTAGALHSYPSTASKGKLILAAVANTGNTDVTLSNAAHGQATVVTIPDGGAAAASVLLTKSAGTQAIATGSLSLTLGNLTAAAGNIAATLGSVAAGTTVTGGTGVVATTGNVVATAGNVVAGSSGAPGTLVSFPATAANGTLIVAALNAGAAFNTTIRNSVMGQASVVSIPDPGAATANFILSAATTTQTIGTGLSIVGVSNVQTTGGGNFLAGASGTAGFFASYPTTAARGYLALEALDNAGAFNVTINNASHGQTTVYTIPDVGAATGGIVVSTSNFVMKSVAGAAAAGGAVTQSFTDAFCTSGSNVIGNWNTQANAAQVLTIVPGNGSFVVTSTADAGVGTFNYIITK